MTAMLLALALVGVAPRREATVAIREQGDMQPYIHLPRTDPTDTDPTHRVQAAHVNANNQRALRLQGFPRATGRDDALDGGSGPAVCQLWLPTGFVDMAAGDTVLVSEDRPTGRRWIAGTFIGAPPNPQTTTPIAFSDAELLDTGLAGTADYDAIQNDLVLVVVRENVVGPPILESMLHRAATPGSAGHGVYGESFLLRNADARNLADVIDDLETYLAEVYNPHKVLTYYCEALPMTAENVVLTDWNILLAAYSRKVRIRQVTVEQAWATAGGFPGYGDVNWQVDLYHNGVSVLTVPIPASLRAGSWIGDVLLDPTVAGTVYPYAAHTAVPAALPARKFTVSIYYQLIAP